mmetsp:Transcript_18300/g.21117  ORF Transcript_18300/g.21117 Transcript_18300/m.21117 type:complete len:132 (+) Transcript_18300:108-503(+)|eukprot:CAMPEP_0194146630 /NCGR_PEP_ID=MMETSP0152-20130528/21148_1 /TAXON_ID=1049557 /ORGANISM="Thalassiothrix antarctica, Strain L6-D1" /LENGTH=131 /DNA_ID=CAMNT_0038847191 /DNA_START=108 /DNA_END=503 /DNA_ORIENTATION=+
MSNSIPLMREPVNMMETGPSGSNFAAVAKQRHPVDDLQRLSTNNLSDIDEVRKIYGSGLAMTLATERQMASKAGGRLPGMKSSLGESSGILIETLLGTDTKLDFCNVFSQPDHLPTTEYNVHKAMERKLNL